MNNKHFRPVILLLFAAFACLSISGCGGSSGSLNSTTNEKDEESAVLDKIYDFDQDGLPDTLDFDDVDEVYYDEDELIQSREISIPSRNYLKRLSAFDSPDSFIADLTAGVEYTVEISKGDFYQYEIGGSIPNVKIFNPKGNELSFDADRDSEFLSPDVIEHSVYPPDEPYVICLTFTPSVTGRYRITLSNLDSNDIYDNITLFVYQELRNDDTGEAGYYKRFRLYDKEGNPSATVVMNDIAALRKAFNNAAYSIIEEQIISGDYESEIETKTTPQVEAYLECIRHIKQHYGIFDDYIEDELYKEINSYDSDSQSESQVTAADSSSDGTKLPAELYGIAYEQNNHYLGEGFFAITANRARDTAIENIKTSRIRLDVPERHSFKTLYKASMVSSQKDVENMSATTVDGKVQLAGFGFKAGFYNLDSFKFGLTSTTFVVHYEKTEPGYRKLARNDAYELTEEARDVLQEEGSKAFREKFGDYFVAGYQYGVTYDAFVKISTKTPEQLSTVKNYLVEAFAKEQNAENTDVGNKAKEFLKNNEADIEIKISTSGININFNELIAAGANDISIISRSLSEFRKKSMNISSRQLQPVYVMFKRYRLLTEVFMRMRRDKYNGLIPIPTEQATEIMNVKQDMITTYAYMRVIRDANDNVMPWSVKAKYEEKFNDFRRYLNENDDVFSNVNKLYTLRNNVRKLNKEFKDIGDRYVFYRMLMDVQKHEIDYHNRTIGRKEQIVNRPYGYNGGQIGYDSFMSSTAVQSDINKGKEYVILDENTFYAFERTREPSLDLNENYAFCRAQVIAVNVNDTRRDALVPAIGTRRVSFHFQCGAGRWMQWKIIVRAMYFAKDIYPFTGLQN